MPDRFPVHLTEAQLRDMWRAAHVNAHEPTRSLVRRGTRNVNENHGFIARTGVAIDARTDTTPGKGDVTLYFINENGDLESTGEQREAYNLSASAVSASAYVVGLLCGGRFIIIYEDCG